MTNLILSVNDRALGLEASDQLIQLPYESLMEKLYQAEPAYLNRQMLDHVNYLDLCEPFNVRRQILPYFVVTDGVNIRLYYRGKGGEARLTGKSSIGYGGHVELGDAVVSINDGKDMLDMASTITSCMRREFVEELSLSDDCSNECVPEYFEFLGVINSSATPVDSVHLGLVFMKRVKSLKIFIDSTDDSIVNEELIPLRHSEKYAEQYNRMENWSRIVYDYLQL